MANIERIHFREVDLADAFFDSLKETYAEFSDWFTRKANEEAYVLKGDGGQIQAFLYLKLEDGPISDINPPLNVKRCLKVGTFKIDAHGTRLGERFVKKIFDHALEGNITHIYVTVFPQHIPLISILTKYGFVEYGRKVTDNGEERVYIKDFSRLTGDVRLDYPVADLRGKNKWLLSIKPKWHTQLFPDSILKNEDARIVDDLSHTNSIQKSYIAAMDGLSGIMKGDGIIIYRTAEQGRPAWYTSVATSLCVVEDMRPRKSFRNLSEFSDFIGKNSVFKDNDIVYWFNRQDQNEVHVIRMTYNVAFTRRPTMQKLVEEAKLDQQAYWGFRNLKDEQFNQVINMGQINEGIIIN